MICPLTKSNCIESQCKFWESHLKQCELNLLKQAFRLIELQLQSIKEVLNKLFEDENSNS